MGQPPTITTSLKNGYRLSLPFRCAGFLALAAVLNYILFSNSGLLYKLPPLAIFLFAFDLLVTGFCIALFYASCLQVLWGDKPVIEFSENAVAYTNFRKMTNIPYVEITGITLNKYVSTRNGTITTLSIERANSGIRRINLDYLDRSAYEIMSQLNQKLPPKMVDFSQLD